jgi:hypothetical protein
MRLSDSFSEAKIALDRGKIGGKLPKTLKVF